MKRAAAFLLVLALVMGGITLWGFANARLDLKAGTARALSAEEFALRFPRLCDQLANGAVRGVTYTDTLAGSADDYTILEYTITVSNRGFVKAQMLEAVVVPLRGDMLCYSQQEAQDRDVNASIDVPAGRQIQLKCYLLTRKDLHAVRDIQVSYYIWGNPFIMKLQYN